MYCRAFLVLAVWVVAVEALPACDSEIWCHGPMLEAVQNARLFSDSKHVVDMNLKVDPDVVLQAFLNLTDAERQSREVMKSFVEQYLEGPDQEFETWQPSDYVESPAFLSKVKDSNLRQFGKDMCNIWSHLGRKIRAEVQQYQERYSLLYLEHPFIVPGGRFRETYYWDSYWVIQGLLLCEMNTTTRGMLQNFVSLIDRYGMVPNGNRIYYTRRSQPPLFIPMMDAYLRFTDDEAFLREIIDSLEKEYAFWMTNRTVDIQYNGQTYTVNRYATPITEPRPESYREDVETVAHARGRDPEVLHSSLASGAESGWDFSSRWFMDGYQFEGLGPVWTLQRRRSRRRR